MDDINMEKKRFLFLRRLPKRSVLLLYILCTMVAACALVTLYLESEETSPPTVHNLLSKNNSLFLDKVPQTSMRHPPHKHVPPPGRSWVVSSTHVDTTQSTPASGNITINNAILTTHHQTSKPTRRRKKTFHNNTRYVYLTTNNSTSTTATTAKGTVTKRTFVRGDTCDGSPAEKDVKLVLLWTSFFGHWEYMPRERFAKCAGCRNCRVTRDRLRLGEADAVVFHARDMSLTDLPAFRLPRQRWVFYCLESPPYSDFPGLQHMRHMFNWTMTYRLDSDVIAQYGSVKRIRPPRPIDMGSLRRAFHRKSASVVWLSSHCPTHGGRDAFVEELRRHIDVDTYGKCGELVCPPESPDHCHGEFASRYRFFLAFENTVCKDYVTEKFFRTLQFDIVPVVFGGAPYEKFAPPGSFVDALAFKSPRHLAFFLRGVGEDFDRYATYFKWRSEYSVVLANEKECAMCRLLHGGRSSSSYADIRKWFVDGSQCRTWESKLGS